MNKHIATRISNASRRGFWPVVTALTAVAAVVSAIFSLGPGAWTTALPAIPAGLPSTVLERRPDLAAAQKTVLSAQVRVGVAQSAWFPSIA